MRNDIDSIEKIVVLFAAILIDFMGFLTAMLVIVFGIGVFLSIIPTMLGLLTIGLWGWLRSGHMSLTQRIKKQGMRFVLVSAGETVSAGLIPTLTIYVLMQFKK